jgi:sigma-E factor negative regulatory protein RseC
MNGRELHWQPATVIAVETDGVLVSFEPLSQCQRCLAGQGCGAGVFGRLFPARSTRLRLSTTGSFEPGQRVQVGLPATELLQAALLLYGLPLLCFLAGAVLGHLVFRSLAYADGAALLSAVLAGAVALIWLRARATMMLNPAVEPLSCKDGTDGPIDRAGA